MGFEQQLPHPFVDSEVVGSMDVGPEQPEGHARAPDGDRCDHRANAGAVTEAGVDHRGQTVESAAEWGQQSLQVGVDEPRWKIVDTLQVTCSLEPHLDSVVDEDVGHGRVASQCGEWSG